ncbi:MAG: O-antigen ligase family protein [Bacteroidales bacterium]|nr:O-antigen ligase family protein [Bacteroidales bacterium]
MLKKISYKNPNKEIVEALVLFFLGILFVYKLPNILADAYFLGILIAFYRSKNDVFWFALLLLFTDAPGALLPNGDLNYGLPMLTSPAFISFQEIFIMLALMKALRKKRRSVFLMYKKIYLLLFFYFLVLLLFSFLIGVSLKDLFKAVKWFLPWSLLYTVPVLIKKQEDWIRFFKLIFAFVFLAFGSQILHLYLGHPPAWLLGTNFQPSSGATDFNFVIKTLDPENYEQNAARPISSSGVMFTGLVGAMFFLLDKQRFFKKNYLYTILFVAIFSIILTATRGWIVAFGLATVFYFIFVVKDMKLFLRIIFPIILMFLLILIFPVIHKQLIGVQKRVSTLEAVTEGDFSAQGTNARVDYSLDLLEVWKGSPIFGWGFTGTFRQNMNGHAGHANLLMNVGIIGFLFFMMWWYELFSKPVSISRKLSIRNPYRRSLPVFTIGFLIFFIIHSTSGQQFTYIIGAYGMSFTQIYFYNYSDFFMRNALREEYRLKKSSADNGQNH